LSPPVAAPKEPPLTAAVLLCAGGGQRFAGREGEHKLLAPFRGRPLVSWAVASARDAALDATVVVSGAADLRGALPADVVVLPNPGWAGGLATSLWLAVEWAGPAGFEAIVVGLGDQPFIASSSWRSLARSPAPIAVATYQGARRNPVRLHRSVWPLLPSTGDRGAQVLMRARPDLVSEVTCAGDASDIDTVEDLARAAGTPVPGPFTP